MIVNCLDLSSSARRNVKFVGPAPVHFSEQLRLILDAPI